MGDVFFDQDDLKGFLVDGLEETGSQLVVDFHAAADDVVAFLLEGVVLFH